MRFPLPRAFLAAAGLLLGLAATDGLADPPAATLSRGYRFTEQTGEALYVAVCQGCHMSKGEGAVGAGRYPALASNANLKVGAYPIHAVLHGQKGMSPFGRMLSDEQVAAVVNYVRTHFGNDYTDAVTAQDVKDAR